MPKLPTQGVKNNGTKSDVISPEQAKKIVNAIQDEFRKMDADTLNDLVKLVDNLDNAFEASKHHVNGSHPISVQNHVHGLKKREDSLDGLIGPILTALPFFLGR
ncbi:hypothetical protein DdX_08521 [Ditylenchus destructor]|uniref:Uncharacterized protein n=1 Tax=Ditylenchus destructor TaxID=166010 RepID=A0AAD4R7A7_9BILA|nr:hypothetical protein DdX_08521 [Ditylenchus destructor]